VKTFTFRVFGAYLGEHRYFSNSISDALHNAGLENFEVSVILVDSHLSLARAMNENRRGVAIPESWNVMIVVESDLDDDQFETFTVAITKKVKTIIGHKDSIVVVL